METIPSFKKYPKDQQLFAGLRRQVYEKVNQMGTERLNQAKVKCFLFPFLYFGCYTVAMYQNAHPVCFYVLYCVMGITMVFMFLNIVHEASHNSLFSNKRVNAMLLHLFDLIGANSYIWKMRHIRLHHNFCNVRGWDSDIQQSSLFKVFPTDETRKIHRYQHLLIFFFYPLYIVNWLFIRDFKDFFCKSQLIRKVCNIPFMEYLKLICFKSIFIFYTVFIPFLFFDYSFAEAITALLWMLVTGGVFALFILLPPHANIANDFPIAEENCLPDSWLMHQLLTTNDVTSANWFTRHVMGNFNYHLAHHLFPNISNVYASEITVVIKNYAMENDLPYKAFSLFGALRNHYRLIRKNGMDPDFFEDDM